MCWSQHYERNILHRHECCSMSVACNEDNDLDLSQFKGVKGYFYKLFLLQIHKFELYNGVGIANSWFIKNIGIVPN